MPVHERMKSANDDRVTCMEVANLIREHVLGFKSPKGMVVVLLVGLRIEIYSFDGIEKASWGYNDSQFSTDANGRRFLTGPPILLSLAHDTESQLPIVLKREFGGCDMSIGKLWKLDPSAPDYNMMHLMHGDDVGVRISFDELPVIK